jgi:hypothetical protein
MRAAMFDPGRPVAQRVAGRFGFGQTFARTIVRRALSSVHPASSP